MLKHRRFCLLVTRWQHIRCFTYTTSCKHSLVLLRMGEIIARNMLSWMKLLIKLLLCIQLAVYIIHLKFLIAFYLISWKETVVPRDGSTECYETLVSFHQIARCLIKQNNNLALSTEKLEGHIWTPADGYWTRVNYNSSACNFRHLSLQTRRHTSM